MLREKSLAAPLADRSRRANRNAHLPRSNWPTRLKATTCVNLRSRSGFARVAMPRGPREKLVLAGGARTLNGEAESACADQR